MNNKNNNIKIFIKIRYYDNNDIKVKIIVL